MDRDAIIECLIAAELAKLHVGQYSRRLLEVVDHEFRSFGRMSDAELAQELERRGLGSAPQPEPADYDDDKEDEEEDEDAAWLVKSLRPSEDDWAVGHG